MPLIFTAIIACVLAGHSQAGGDGGFRYSGCYNTTLLHSTSVHLLLPFDVDNCFKICPGHGSLYAGIEIRNKTCFCDTDIQSKGIKVDDFLCKPCPAPKSSLTCGGKSTLSLYELIPNAISANDNSSVSFLLAGNDGVSLYSSQRHKILGPPNKRVVAVDYHYQKNEVFAVWDDQLFRFPNNVTASNIADHTSLVANMTLCSTFVVDWVHNHLFWAYCGGFSGIMISDLDGSNEEVLVTLDDGNYEWAKDMVVDPYKGVLFWTCGTSLKSIGLDGRRFKTVVHELPAKKVSSLAIDMITERVYFSGLVNGSTLIFYTTYSGSECVTTNFVSTDDDEIRNFDIYRSKLYFVTRHPNGESSIYKGLADSFYHKIDLVAYVEAAVSRLKIFEPERQLPAKVDNCTYRGCSHHCVVESATAKCFCPPRYKVGSDEKTCEIQLEEERDLFLTVMGGIFSVCFILLSAGVLMCLMDKLWSKINPTVVRVTNPNNYRLSFRNDERVDSANLI